MSKPRTESEGKALSQSATRFQYTIKFLCGGSSEKSGNQHLTTGVFFTLINVHNPSAQRVTFSWKVVLETKAGISLNPPQISTFRSEAVDSNSAFKIDCVDIFSVVVGGPVIVGGTPITMGFLVIVSPAELDVTAVYTARPQRGEVSSIDVETIQPRTMVRPRLRHR